METTSSSGLSVGVNVSLDKKTIALFGVVLFVGMVAALLVYRATL